MTSIPNIKCAITFFGLRTRTCLPPWLSFSIENTRSTEVLWLYRASCAGSIRTFSPERGGESIRGTCPRPRTYRWYRFHHVQVGHAAGRHLRQRNRHLGIMHGCRCQDETYLNFPINDVRVQLVADPAFAMALAVFLGPDITYLRQIREVGFHTAIRLQFQTLRVRWGLRLASARDTVA